MRSQCFIKLTNILASIIKNNDMGERSLNQANMNNNRKITNMYIQNKKQDNVLKKKQKQKFKQPNSYDYNSDNVPPLLDLSMSNFVSLDNSISNQFPHSRKTAGNSLNQVSNFPNWSHNIQKNLKVYKPKNDSLETTKIQSKDENWESWKEDQHNFKKKYGNNWRENFGHRNNSRSPRQNSQIRMLETESTKQGNIDEMTEIAMSVYEQEIIAQHFNKNNIGPKNPFKQQQSSKQLLTSLLTNPQKLEKFLQHLLQQTLIQKKQQNEYKKQLNNSYSKKQLKKAKNKKQAKVGQILGCLLVKIRQSSIAMDQHIPNVFVSGKGDVAFDFGIKNQSLLFTGKDEDSYIQNSAIVSRREEKIKELNQKLNEQNNFIEQIKQEYESIIYNFAATIYNIKNTHQRKQLNQNGHERKISQQRFQKSSITRETDNDETDLLNDPELRDLIKQCKLDPQALIQRLSKKSNKRRSSTLKGENLE